MNYVTTKGTESYKEAIQAVENIEPPALGFLRPSDFQGVAITTRALIKQNNLQIQLLTQIAEEVKSIRSDLKTLLEKQQQARSTEVLPEALLTNLQNLTLGQKEAPKEARGKILVFKDPLKILAEEKQKARK